MRHWFTRLRSRLKRPQAKDMADFLIWRSTAVFGDFRMDVMTRLVLKEHPQLTDEEWRKILNRYYEHVNFWNIDWDIIAHELFALASAAGRPPPNIHHDYDCYTLDIKFKTPKTSPIVPEGIAVLDELDKES